MAIALSKGHKDVAVDVYEGAHQLNEIGAGVAVWRRPFQVMKAFGLRESMSKELEDVQDEDVDRRFSGHYLL